MDLRKRNRAPVTAEGWKHTDDAQRMLQIDWTGRKPVASVSAAVMHNVRAGFSGDRPAYTEDVGPGLFESQTSASLAPPPSPLRLLILGDAAADAEREIATLEAAGHTCEWERVDNRETFLKRLSESTYDVILADYSLPAIDGMAALRFVCERQLQIPFIIVADALGEERAIDGVKAGATDYVLKTHLARLGPAVQRALQEKEEQRQLRDVEGALRRSEERFRIVAHATHEAVWDWDLLTDSFDGAESIQELFGYTTGQVQPRLQRLQWWDDNIHPDDREEVLSGIRSVIDSGGRLWAAEYRFRRGDGSFTSVFDRGEVIHDPSGKPVRMIGSMMDITARKRAEEEIRGLSESLREEAEVEGAVARAGEELIAGLDRPALLDRVCRVTTAVLGCDVCWTVLPSGEGTYYAPAAAAGATLEEQEEVPLLRFSAETTDPLLAVLGRSEVLQITTSEETGGVDPLALRFGSGVTLYVPLRRGGDVIGVLAAGRRATAQAFAPRQERIARRLAHLASLALEAARLIERLEEANRLKSDFVATTSHELRTPISTIMGYNDLLREDAFGPLNDEQRRVLLVMDGKTQQLLDLINAMLDLSRLEARRVPRSIGEVDPRELLADIREESHHLDGSEVKIVWKCAPHLARLRTDAMKVKVIVKNLLHNAVKFTKAGQVTIEARTRRGGLALSVTDTGIGIPEDVLSIIFKPFRQAEAASTRRYGGLGLGLYLVRRLVDLLEGSIAVESEVGRGSVFHVWVPHVPARPRPARRRSDSADGDLIDRLARTIGTSGPEVRRAKGGSR